ncbi:NPC intracellular cholesterol transporter 2 [Tetranychus urticae]|uniref:MD-2-related lipid-recognition domain-containing protein n=1 Tax=Tetranychus urticae TaxID=32264 RepID=T1KLD6_TETUR|nr:NPC intracellular cholesterol transporter 2 [Tetranychus urticae]
MIRTIAVFALFLAYAQARNVSFTNCSPNGKINFVNIIPCETEPCNFKTGEEVHLNGEFVSTLSASKPTLKSELKMGDDWIAYADVHNDACEYTNCPIEANVPYRFALNTEVFDWPRSFETEMRFRAIGDDGTTELICGKTTIGVTKA